MIWGDSQLELIKQLKIGNHLGFFLEFDSLKPKNGIFKMITLDFIEFFVLI